jgi:LDH2 family malate/lactate/ureidoglycolate dehydrogenase
MSIDGFRPAQDFKNDMDNWIRTFRNARAVEGQRVLIPGDPEREMEQLRATSGIDLLDPVVESLEELSKKFGIIF